MTFCSSSKVAVFSLLTIDVDLCLNMSEDLNQIYCRRSLDMNVKSYHTEIATFNDFCTAPEILDRLIKSDGYVNVFNENKNQVSRIRVSHTNTTQMIEYTYKGNTSIHKFMIGERVTDDAEVQY